MKAILENINKSYNVEILSENESHFTLLLNENDSLISLVSLLKEELRFKILIDICGADYPTKSKRFEVIYQFLNIEDNLRATIKLTTSENEEISSIETIFNNAVWFQRETYDMYGILFKNTKDLRRILTDYDFEGFPLRKDFPLTGFTELQYDPILQKIIKIPVNLSQEYRNFDFETPWESVQYSVKK